MVFFFSPPPSLCFLFFSSLTSFEQYLLYCSARDDSPDETEDGLEDPVGVQDVGAGERLRVVGLVDGGQAEEDVERALVAELGDRHAREVEQHQKAGRRLDRQTDG